MILNYGWDPMVTALVIGAMTSILPTAFYELWRRHGVTETANLVVIMVLTWLGWGFTSYPLQWRLIATMFLMAYAVNQLLDRLIQAAIRHRHRRAKTSGPLTTAGVQWQTLDWKKKMSSTAVENPYPSRVKATQEKYPWRTTIRTVFEATVSFAAMWPLMVVALDLGEGPWVAASLAMTAAVTRVMAVPEVNAWLEKYLPWLAAEPTGGDE